MGGPQAALVSFSIRFRGVVVALACVLFGYGLHRLQEARYDVFPEFAPPQVGIQTEAPGLAPEQVETLVTQPLENAVNGVPGLRSLRSSSIQGLSVITAVFDPEGDIHRDRQAVAERLAVAGARLPQGVAPPSIAPLTSSTSIVLVAGLTSPHRSLMELRTAAAWTVRPRLLAVPGVAKVAIFGGERRSIQIQVHPDELVRFGLGLNDVLSAARRATGVRGAGFIDTENQRVVLQSEGQASTPAELARAVLVNRGGTSVPLGRVASIREASAPAIGGASIMGQPAVVMDISEQYGADTIAVTKRVSAALRDLRASLQGEGIEVHDDLFRPASFIDTATGNVRASLLMGGALVAAVLLLFLFDLRTAAISFAAIPLSMLAAVVLLQRLGITLNTMTLGGLAISIGVVVDDAVVDIENIVRRLRANAAQREPRPAARVVLDACLEVRGAVVYATFAVILVVLPIVTLPGIAGRLFGPLGVAYALAVLASLFVTLTLTPALSMLLLARGPFKAAEPPLVRWSKARYERLLRKIAGRPGATLAAAMVFIAAGCAALPFFGGTFIPELKEGHFIVHMSAVPGTSIAESLRIGGLVTQALRSVPAVRSVAQRVGRAELADDANGTHYSEFEVDLKPLGADEAETAQSEIRKSLSGIPGVNFAVNTFLTERIEETLSGAAAPVSVNIFGNDLDTLESTAREVARVLGAVRGATDVQVQAPPGMPRMSIRLRQADLERWGLAALDVLDTIRTAFEGNTVAQTHEGGRYFPVTVILDPQSRSDIARFGGLPLRTPAGGYVRLRQVADVGAGAGRFQISHQSAQRLQTVTAAVAGRDLTSFVDDAKTQIAAGVSLPAGTYVAFAGEAEAQSRSSRDLLLNSIVAGAGVVLLLSIAMRNAANLLLVLANLPFAFVGGVLAVFASGGLLSLGSMVGFVTLFGITLRNSILMISHYEHLVAAEGAGWGLDTAVRGAADRLAPILMTSMVTALGVLPLAIGMGDAGREIEGPMAVVILGGLLSSMALNLLVLPTLALRYGRFEAAAPRDDLSG